VKRHFRNDEKDTLTTRHINCLAKKQMLNFYQRLTEPSRLDRIWWILSFVWI